MNGAEPAVSKRTEAAPSNGERVLIFAPTGRDGELTRRILAEAGHACLLCSGADSLAREAEAGVGAVLIAEEALAAPEIGDFLQVLKAQPPWSDLPLIVFSRPDAPADVLPDRLGGVGNVTILERPVRIATLVSAVRTALRARSRQYEVRDLVQRLEVQSQRKDEFLAMLGHELRNPLGVIRNALATPAWSQVNDERALAKRDVIDRQARNLSRIVDDLLEVSRVTLGRIELQRQVLDLQPLVARVVESIRPAAEEHGHTLTFEPAEAGPVCVDGDPVRLEQVLTNLLYNAVKYTPSGGHIQVSLGTASECGGESSGLAVLTVRDNGVGIAVEMLGRVFELFSQAKTGVDRREGGLGLGLTLVRRLVEMHGGTVRATSEGPGCGSRFSVVLPLVASQPAAASDERRLNGHVVPAAGARVLIVEDNCDGRQTLREVLESWGYAVDEAPDGEAGLKQVLEAAPHVALIDIGLPGLDGHQVAREIRSRMDGAAPRLIAMTGYSQPEDRERSMHAGFDAHLVKPVDFDELQRLLQVSSG